MGEFGRLDILVNNAGINIRKAPQRSPRGMAQRDQHQPHQRLPVLAGGLSGHEGRGRRQDHQYRLDDVDLRRRFAPAYAASKGGIVQFTRSCAMAWAEDNIQVNAVLPGWIDTELTKRARQQIDGLHERVLARTPAARWGASPTSPASRCSSPPASDFVTGAAIPVDGGYSVMG